MTQQPDGPQPEKAESDALDRPVPLRCRQDLEICRLRFGKKYYWGVKDPISLRYYHLCDEEYGILQMLNGQVTLRDIAAEFERRFAPLKLSFANLQSFLSNLAHERLAVADISGYGRTLLEHTRRASKQAFVTKLTNITALRLPGYDPEPLLTWLYPKCRWLFSRPAVLVMLAIIFSALGLLFAQHSYMWGRLPEFNAFFSLQNALWLAVAIALTKIVHELGHALTCRHFGGECHQMGILFLVFVPCLYCDVSDSWMLRDKWHRMAVGAAGMIVELVIASLCTWLWWFSYPGWLNSLCLNMMVVCSINTLLLNGNPLLRYDGYYLLADGIEIPNLKQQSAVIVQHTLLKWFTGIDDLNDRAVTDRPRLLLFAYGMASILYRCFIMVAILWLVDSVLEQYRLQIFTKVLAFIMLAGLLAAPVMQVAALVRGGERGLRDRVNWSRLLFRLGFVAALAFAILFYPWPYHIKAPVYVQPQNAQRIYVEEPGQLLKFASAGSEVTDGQTLAVLQSHDLRLDIERLRGQKALVEAWLANARIERRSNPESEQQIPAYQERLADIQQQLQRRLADQRKLTLTASRAGTVYSVPARKSSTTHEELPFWSGRPNDPQNNGCFLETGTLVCLVGEPESREAILSVDQSDISFIETGQTVRMIFDERPADILTGTVVEIAEEPVDTQRLQESLSRESPDGAQRNPDATPATTYLVRVAIDAAQSAADVRIWASGRAKIDVGPFALYHRLLRFTRRTFRFEH